MTRRFLSKGSQLHEVWCGLVPGSDKATGTLQIGELAEENDEYDIYVANDTYGFSLIEIKVYKNPEVKAYGRLLLGKSTDCVVDVYGNPHNRAVVFEIVEGWDDYLNWCRTGTDPYAPPTDNAADDGDASVSSECGTDAPQHIEYADEDTGDIYRLRDDGTKEYQLPDGTYKSDKRETSAKESTPAKDNCPTPKGFAAVAGMDELKAQLTNEVLWPLEHKELMEQYRLHALNGMLLYGPPGCGKTYIAQRFAEESGMSFRFVSAGDMGSRYIHDTAVNIKDMFDKAKSMAPCILCIDEIDSLLPDRSHIGIEGACADFVESVNEFLSRMNNCNRDGIFVIGMTNNPLALDPALLRTGRMDKIIYVGMPDETSRKALLEFSMKDRPQDEGIDFAELARLSDGMNASDIEFMVNSVAMASAMTQTPITFDKLAEQAKTQRRSVYLPKDEEQEKTTPVAQRKVIGFTMQPQKAKKRGLYTC